MNDNYLVVRTGDLALSLEKYLAAMEAQLRTLYKNEEERVSKLVPLRSMTPESSIEFVEQLLDSEEYVDFVQRHIYEFPNYFRYSFIVLLYLTMENHMNYLCEELRQRRGLVIKINDLKGDAIERWKTYLYKVANLKNTHDALWTRMDSLSKVRNCIAHANGNIELSNASKRLSVLVKQEKGLSISNGGWLDDNLLIIEQEFCSQALKDVVSLWKAILRAAGFKLARKRP